MAIWRSVVGKLWLTIIALVALVLIILGSFLLEYIDMTFSNADQIKRLFIYVGIIGFFLTTFFAFFLSTRITRPLVQMKEAADMISMGRYGIRVPVSSQDEIGELAKTLNHMATKLQATVHDLSMEKEHLAGILRSMTDAVITFSVEGNVILANPQGQKILRDWHSLLWEQEASPDEQLGQVPAPLRVPFETAVTHSRDTISKVNVLNGVWSVAMTPLYSGGPIHGAVAVLRDVTEEHRLEKLRKDFVANVSHELRTPISMLQGYSEALLDDIAATPEERNELVQVIYDESLRMGRLVKDLLDLARMEAGHLELNFGKVDLRVLLSRVNRKFSVMCKEKGIRLELAVADGEFVCQHADEDRLEQVLTNLLDNAVRHTPSGKAITIRLKPDTLHHAEAILLEIADEGQGIPAQDVPYVFERFYKADKARTRGNSSGGTGLGLAIVKNIVEAHQGQVSVTSTEHVGTTFSVKIPVKEQRKGK
ncbi:MAG TPA: ATP-binding protein [Bacilli bacterium]